MPYEFLFKNALFPAYETLIRRRGTTAWVAEYERQQWFERSQIESLQLRKLNALLTHCWRTVPFLRQHWSDHGLKPGVLTSVRDLVKYPTLTKSQITGNYAGMTSSEWRGRTLSKTTGGSTGDPFRFEYTMEVYARRTAVMWRAYGWAGAGLGSRAAYIWGSGPPQTGWPGLKTRLYHSAFNRRYFDAFSLSEENIDQRIADLVRFRPKAIVGYVAPVVLIARRMLALGQTMEGVRGVITGAEALFEPERRDIERAFGCAAYNTYGSREVMLMAAECERHEGLHVNADHLVFETVDTDGNSAPTGTSGDVLITDLHNYGMPMVRYVNGDRATYASTACTCRRGLPLLSSIDGRVLDLIETPDGRHVPGEFFVYAMLDWPDVRQWQVVQTAPDCVQFRLVVPAPWSQERRDNLTARVRSKMGPSIQIEIVEVDNIPTMRSGKRRLTIRFTPS